MRETDAIRVLVVDDHRVVRQGLAAYLMIGFNAISTIVTARTPHGDYAKASACCASSRVGTG